MCIGKKNKEIQPFFIVFLVGKVNWFVFQTLLLFFKFLTSIWIQGIILRIYKLFSLGVVCTIFILFEPEFEPHDLFIFSRFNKCFNGNI